MSLAHAIRKNAKTLAAAQTTYKENVVVINTLITSVLTSRLPALNSPPPDWQQYVTAYEQANGDALNWVNNVMARLLNVPDEVRTYNDTISQLLQDAKQQTTLLIAQPGNPTALEILNQDLNGLSGQLNLVVTFISGAVVNVRDFKDKLPGLATQLQTIAQKSVNDSNADKGQIDQLNAQIEQLRADINSKTAAIIALAVVDGIALTIGVVATIALWPIGAAVWFVMGPAVAAATTFIGLDAAAIVSDKRQIEAIQSSMTGITADVSTLNTLAQNYGDMATKSVQIEQNLQAVLVEWQTLESEVNQGISDIRTALADASSANFTAVLSEIDDAITAWNEAYNQAGALHLDLNVNNATLNVGMTPAAVQAALAGSETLNIIEYYNRVAA